MKRPARSLATALLLLAAASPSHAVVGTCDTAGPVEVESTSSSPTAYGTLGAAFGDINAGLHTGTVNVEICGDTDEGTATAVLNASGAGSAFYTSIMLKPVGGAARRIAGSTTAGNPLIDLNGADNVTIDGVVSGGDSLAMANTTASTTDNTSTIRFIGGATSNTVTNTSIKGSYSASATTATNLGGSVFFSTDTVTASGNDSNTISNCQIGPAGANLPTRGIFSRGTTTTAAQNNSGLIVDNNDVFDFFSATAGSAGIDLVAGTTDATISNNRLYQTAPRTMTTTGLNHSGIRLSNTSGNNHLISGNTIGFASSDGTGTYTLVFPTTTSASFTPITLAVGSTTATSVQGNTIARIAMSGGASGSSSTAPFRGLYVDSGLTTIGDVTGNMIGSQSATDSITFTTNSTSLSEVLAIVNVGSSVVTVSNNLIGGITSSNANPQGGARLRGIYSSAGHTTVQDNTIGGTAANSLRADGAWLTFVIGVDAHVGFSDKVTVAGNTIRNLTVTGVAQTSNPSVTGIELGSGSAANHTISQNTVHSLASPAVSGNTILTGIRCTGSAGTTLIARNFIHSFSASSPTAVMNGVEASNEGTATHQNNMIRLGIDAGGAAVTTGLAINGIHEISGTNNFHLNSVYVGGAGATGSAATFAFNSEQVNVTRAYRDNIFFNARSNFGGALGKHYAVQVGGTTPDPTGLTLDHNVYFASGTGGVLGRFSGADVASLAAWQAAVGQDVNSISANPRYLAATGTAATVNLHIDPAVTSVIEGNGLVIGSVTDDFDGETRSTLTPTDIGADAGLYIGIDLLPPTIDYTPLPNSTDTTSRTLSITVTDLSGVPTAGTGVPVVYFRKGTGGAFASAQCTHVGGNGYDCVLIFSSIGGVVGGDQIQYYVAAQDAAAFPNVTTNPEIGASGFTVNPPGAGTPPTTPNTFTVAPIVSGTKTVCASGCDFTTLTGATGIFHYINIGSVTGNIDIEIAGDLTAGEDGSVGLNPLNEDPPASDFSVRIYPTGAPRTISNTAELPNGFIRLNAADRVTIDGSLGGTGTDRSLTITDTNTVPPCGSLIWLQSNGADGATQNTIQNVNVVGSRWGAFLTTLVGIGAGGPVVTFGGTGNNDNTYRNNSVSTTQYGIYSRGASAAQKSTGTVITRNSINTPAPNHVARGGIFVGYDDGAQITQNTIEGMATQVAVDAFGISLGLPAIGNPDDYEVTNATVARNVIGKIIHTGSWSAAGISVARATSGTTLIANNVIYGVGGNATEWRLGAGIYIGAVAGSTTQVYSNSVWMNGTFSSTATLLSPHYALVIAGGNSGAVDAQDNALYNATVYTGAGGVVGKNYAIGLGSVGFSFALSSNYNDLFTSTGPNYFIGRGGLGTIGTNYPTLSDWQTLTDLDANSISADPGFISSTDLHIDTTGGPTPVENAGTPLAAVTDDIDGDARHALAPDIGADETDLVCFAMVCTPFDTECGIASCDPNGGSGNCDLITPRTNGTVCRDVADDCDVAETCNGANVGACPTNQFEPATTECRPSAVPDCDPAEFCTGDDAACPADVVDPNDPVAGIDVDKSGTHVDISWSEVAPGPFNVYRGSDGPGRVWAYNHGCLVEEAAGPSVTDTDVPLPHIAFYYLVSRVQPPCDESSLGQDSSSNEIPNDNACPSAGDDFDGDGALDYLDNCPSDPNAGQEDGDGDSHGDVCDNCPADFNPGQEDTDQDTLGDVCDARPAP